MKPKELPALVKEAFKDWSDGKVPRLAAALSFHTLSSGPPLLSVVAAIAGFFSGSC